eukprot:1268582-Rhodomonas_salina.1
MAMKDHCSIIEKVTRPKSNIMGVVPSLTRRLTNAASLTSTSGSRGPECHLACHCVVECYVAKQPTAPTCRRIMIVLAARPGAGGLHVRCRLLDFAWITLRKISFVVIRTIVAAALSACKLLCTPSLSRSTPWCARRPSAVASLSVLTAQ